MYNFRFSLSLDFIIDGEKIINFLKIDEEKIVNFLKDYILSSSYKIYILFIDVINIIMPLFLTKFIANLARYIKGF